MARTQPETLIFFDYNFYAAGIMANDPVAVDDAFRLLADEHRRYVLYYLRRHDRTTVEELATVLSGWLGARNHPTAGTTPAERRRLLAELHHAHLPQLADGGVVRYDSGTGTVELETLEPVFETLLDRSLERECAASANRGASDRGADGAGP